MGVPYPKVPVTEKGPSLREPFFDLYILNSYNFQPLAITS